MVVVKFLVSGFFALCFAGMYGAVIWQSWRHGGSYEPTAPLPEWAALTLGVVTTVATAFLAVKAPPGGAAKVAETDSKLRKIAKSVLGFLLSDDGFRKLMGVIYLVLYAVVSVAAGVTYLKFGDATPEMLRPLAPVWLAAMGTGVTAWFGVESDG